jgi:hypothetical protein
MCQGFKICFYMVKLELMDLYVLHKMHKKFVVLSTWSNGIVYF